MNTVGQIIQQTRENKGYSLDVVVKETKIRKSFVIAIEQEKWEQLPEYPVVQGFVKNISQLLGLDEEKMVATLRRDYPPKTVPINPKPDVSKKLAWSPRLTFVLGIAVVFILILGYLGYQYLQFIKPPKLVVYQPTEDEIVIGYSVKVIGTTDPDATLTVNNQPVIISESGDFEVELEISEDTSELVVKSSSRSGKETEVHRRIKVDTEG